jgi:hypothetical protein
VPAENWRSERVAGRRESGRRLRVKGPRKRPISDEEKEDGPVEGARAVVAQVDGVAAGVIGLLSVLQAKAARRILSDSKITNGATG